MAKMKIGIIKEGKFPPDKRVPVNPEHCARLVQGHPDVELVVQSSDIRAYKDEEYSARGILIVDDVSDCDILLGVKEVPKKDLLPGKIYFFFSHTYKEQPYNAALLKKILEKRIQLVDYELLKDNNGIRLIGFGGYAGIVGSFNAFRGWGEKFGAYTLKPANMCHDREEMESELNKISLPNNFKMVMSGHGRVGKGALEIVKKLNIRQVSPEEYLSESFNEPVFTHIDSDDYNDRADGSPFERAHFYKNPEMYVGDFFKFAKTTDMYIACHYWDADAPLILTKENLKDPQSRIKFVADISCDILEPIASTLRPSTIAEPFYGYDPETGSEVAFSDQTSIGVMAVDNLPCELPRDASNDFGEVLLSKVFPALLGDDSDKIIYRASETNLQGELMPDFKYLKGYVEGAE